MHIYVHPSCPQHQKNQPPILHINNNHTNMHRTRKNQMLQNSVEIRRSFQHISSIGFGLSLAYLTLGLDYFYSCLSLTAIEYVLLLMVTRTSLKSYGLISTMFCLTVLLIGFVFALVQFTLQSFQRFHAYYYSILYRE